MLREGGQADLTFLLLGLPADQEVKPIPGAAGGDGTASRGAGFFFLIRGLIPVKLSRSIESANADRN